MDRLTNPILWIILVFLHQICNWRTWCKCDQFIFWNIENKIPIFHPPSRQSRGNISWYRWNPSLVFTHGSPLICSSYRTSLQFCTLTFVRAWTVEVRCHKPVPKVAQPKACGDFRPLTVTPMLSRLLEKLVVRQFIFLVLIENDDLSDLFAFRPTGSTTAALSIFHIKPLHCYKIMIMGTLSH